MKVFEPSPTPSFPFYSIYSLQTSRSILVSSSALPLPDTLDSLQDEITPCCTSKEEWHPSNFSYPKEFSFLCCFCSNPFIFLSFNDATRHDEQFPELFNSENSLCKKFTFNPDDLLKTCQNPFLSFNLASCISLPFL